MLARPRIIMCTPMTINVEALEKVLANIGWSLPRMEAAIGERITPLSSDQTRKLIWSILNDKEARNLLYKFQVDFPYAHIVAIRKVET
jgi:hypothetical protein